MKEDAPSALVDDAEDRPRRRLVVLQPRSPSGCRVAIDQLTAETDAIELDGREFTRPRTRGDCIDGPRPCPWVACKHHLYLDVDEETGTMTIRSPDTDPLDLEHSCSLDEADAGEQRFEDIGAMTGVTKQRAQQIEHDALVEMRRRMDLGDGPSDRNMPRDRILRTLRQGDEPIDAGALIEGLGIADRSRRIAYSIVLRQLVTSGIVRRRAVSDRVGTSARYVYWLATEGAPER